MARASQPKRKITRYPGTKDFFFEEARYLTYVLETWRKTCKRFGFSEYYLPLLEEARLYKEKSGEEVANKQLYEFKDKGGRIVAIRPEATPGLARAVSEFYKGVKKPLFLFSIMNFMRYERPQSGRMREFWQLNVDIIGEKSLFADLYIIVVALEVILAFGKKEKAFRFYINSRPLSELVLSELGVKKNYYQEIFRFIDRLLKLNSTQFEKALKELSKKPYVTRDLIDYLTLLYSSLQEDSLDTLFTSSVFSRLQDQPEYKKVFEIINTLKEVDDYKDYIFFNPAIVRGLDYYDGIVFEAFDTSENNKRSLLGGGRYNTLGTLFGIDDLPAVGFGLGNYTFMQYLKNWGLLEKIPDGEVLVFVPILEKMPFSDYVTLVRSKKLEKILKEEYNITKPISFVFGTKPMKVKEALRYANKRGYQVVILYGEREREEKKVTVKVL